MPDAEGALGQLDALLDLPPVLVLGDQAQLNAIGHRRRDGEAHPARFGVRTERERASWAWR
ncbi:hypothetical protein GCM10010483_69680 [Actinokineospora diospyrosa]